MKPAKSQVKPKTFDITVAQTLAEQPRPELAFHIDQILPKGLYLFAGSPKAGKSFMILHMCGAIATASEFWGYPTTQSRVLYLALEDTSDSISRRIQDLKLDQYDLSKLDIAFDSLGLNSGFDEYVSTYIKEHSYTKLMVIDTFADIRDTLTGATGNPYFTDKRDMKKLRSITQSPLSWFSIVTKASTTTPSMLSLVLTV